MSSDELRSWVVALHAPRAVHKFRLKAWAGFLRERGCVVVVPAKDLRRRATHVLLVDPPCAEEDDPRFAAYLASMPASCVAGAGGGTPPTILRQEWMYDSIRQKRALPTEPYALGSKPANRTPLADVQPAPRASNPHRAHPNDDSSAKPPAVPPATRTLGDETQPSEILRAANDARDETRRLADAADGDPGPGVVGGVEVGTLLGCLAAECDAAASSAASHAPWEGASTRGAFAGFRREGYPGFVGATNVVEDEIERRLGARWDAREAERVAGEDAAWAAAAAAAKAAAKAGTRARAVAGVGSSRPGVGGRTLLLDLPDGVLGEVMERLCLRDALNAGATCRRLLDVAFGRRVRRRRRRRVEEVGGIGRENDDTAGDDTAGDDEEFVLGGSARDPPPWPDRSGGVGQHACVRVMTWNLKNNDPDPANRFANQPGANERGGGWHWHVRCPIVARSVQRDAPHVLYLQEDLGCMASELMCAREMRESHAAEYRCYPPPVRSLRAADALAKKRRVLLSPSETDPLCGADALDEAIANALRTGARWEQCSVWWRDDAFEALDAGQFEWIDGRTRARLRGSAGSVPGSVPGSVVAFTWVLLRLKGDERGSGMVKGVTRSIDKRIVACSTHVEAGHDWNDDVPAKRNSAICVRACVRRIQDRHGRDVPIVVGGDFNMQKIQQHYRLLTGEGAGISRGLVNVSGNLQSETARATGKGGGGGGGSPAASPPAASPPRKRKWDLDEERADRASELVDVFACLDADNPNARFDRKHRGVRSGGHAGTTWHGWEGPAHAEMISNTIAKHCKHNAQLGWWDPGENTGGGTGDGGVGGWYASKRRRGWGRDDLPGVGGGHGGTVGGARGTSSNRVAGAVGHQRHIDHVFVARGDGVRDDTRGDVQCRARCVRAFVRVDTNSETFRRRGESRCACGAHAVGGPMSDACACHDVDGVWASDHFPVAADLRLSWSVDEGEPVRRFRSTRREWTP